MTTLFHLMVGLAVTAGSTHAAGSGRVEGEGLHAWSGPAPGGLVEARRVVGLEDDGKAGEPDEEEAPHGQLMLGFLLSPSHKRLIVKGDGTKKRPLRVYLRIAPFSYLYVTYWDDGLTDDPAGKRP